MDEIDLLNEREMPTVRRDGRAQVFTVDTGLAANTFDHEDFRAGLYEALKEDPELIRLGLAVGEVTSAHAPFRGASVEGPVATEPTVRYHVQMDFGAGRINRPAIEIIIADTVQSELALIKWVAVAA